MANYTDKEKQEVKNLFQSLVVLGQIGIKEIADGIAIADYSDESKVKLVKAIKQLPNCSVSCYLDTAKSLCPKMDVFSICRMADYLVFSDLCELLDDKDIDSCLKHSIDYPNILEGYERDQADERSGWQSMIHLDNAERVADINADDMRRTWSLFV